MSNTLTGVFPVLATPFHADLTPDAAGLAAIARYAIGAGADGVVFPGVASEYETLTADERASLVRVVADAARGRVPFVVGGSAPDAATTMAVMRQARDIGAATVMIMAPKAQARSADMRVLVTGSKVRARDLLGLCPRWMFAARSPARPGRVTCPR